MITPRSVPPPEAVARHYDEVDPFYRALWGDHLHHGLWERGDETPEEAVLALVDRVAERAGLSAACRDDPQLWLPLPGLGAREVVDIGCGYGATARRLARTRGASVTGMTLSAAQLAVAKEKAAASDPVRFHLGDWLENELPDASFDAAIAIESLSHMNDRSLALKQAARVLRQGGRLVTCVWLANPDATPWQIRHLLRPICEEGRLAGLDTADAQADRIRAAGFQDITFEDVSARVARTWTICARRMLRALLLPSSWRYLLGRGNVEKGFALTVVRMVVAFRVGALRYGIFSAGRGNGKGGGRGTQGSEQGEGSGERRRAWVDGCLG